MRKLKPRAIYLTPFNMKLGKTHQLKSLKSFNTLNISGKGGTSIGPVFTDIIEKKPMVTVIFTDGKFRVPKELPKTPIIWGIINNPDWDQPCGKKLDIEV
jgi:predicted metal-dependent peptidase